MKEKNSVTPNNTTFSRLKELSVDILLDLSHFSLKYVK